jgi:hypothetical protein
MGRRPPPRRLVPQRAEGAHATGAAVGSGAVWGDCATAVPSATWPASWPRLRLWLANVGHVIRQHWVGSPAPLRVPLWWWVLVWPSADHEREDGGQVGAIGSLEGRHDWLPRLLQSPRSLWGHWLAPAPTSPSLPPVLLLAAPTPNWSRDMPVIVDLI